MLSFRRQIFAETFEAAGPSTFVQVTRCDRVEDRLVQPQFRFSVQVIEGHRQHCLSLSRIAIGVGPAIGTYQAFWWNDFAEPTLLPMVYTVWPAHMEPITSAGAGVIWYW